MRIIWNERWLRGQYGKDNIKTKIISRLCQFVGLFIFVGPAFIKTSSNKIRAAILLYAWTHLDGSEISGYGRPSWLIMKFWRAVVDPIWFSRVSQEVIVLNELEKNRQYLFACHPHGVLPLGIISLFNSHNWNKHIQNHTREKF
eukprot:UN29410